MLLLVVGDFDIIDDRFLLSEDILGAVGDITSTIGAFNKTCIPSSDRNDFRVSLDIFFTAFQICFSSLGDSNDDEFDCGDVFRVNDGLFKPARCLPLKLLPPEDDDDVPLSLLPDPLP